MHEPLTMVSYFTHSAVMLAVLGAMAWLGDRLLRRVGPLAQHRMWVAALLAGVALPLLPVGALIGRIGLTGWFSHADANAVGGAGTVTYSMIAAGAGHWTISPLLAEMLAGAYLLTVVFGVLRLLWRWRRTHAMTRRAAGLTLDAAARARVEGAARWFGVAAPEMLCSGETRGPVVLGVRRALLLVPEGFFAGEGSHDADADAALAHECAHLARRDFAKNLLYEYVAAVVAYHPAAWLMRRRIVETRELVCDEMAATAVGGRPEYASSLLRLTTAMARAAAHPVYASPTQAIGVFDADILEERIMRLTMDLPAVSRTRKIAMAAVTACALLGGAMTATALSFAVTPQDGATATSATKEKIYKVGNGVSAPVLTHSVDAEYSKKAKDAKHQGVSVVSLVVDAHGMPQRVHTIRKLGMGLDEKAIEAVRQYRFKPAMHEGEPVAVALSIEVNFRLY
ncbi:MAG TPA: M56 family metallopeptidase [Acidobacteriaceae bacterium]|nr:M56 family metallopeptidase [Acidobacteriaceae bacterium]